MSKDQTDEKSKAIYSELATAKGSATITCIMEETPTGREVEKFYNGKKKRRRLVCFIEGCGHGEAISSLTRREASYAID